MLWPAWAHFGTQQTKYVSVIDFLIWFPISFKKTIHERRNDFKIWLPFDHSTSPGRWSDSLKFHFSEILRILRVKSSFEHLLKITYQNEYTQNLCVFFSVFQGVDEILKICWQISKFFFWQISKFNSSFYPIS